MSNMGQKWATHGGRPGLHIAARDWRRDYIHVGRMAFASRSGVTQFSGLESFVNPYMSKLAERQGPRGRNGGFLDSEAVRERIPSFGWPILSSSTGRCWRR